MGVPRCVHMCVYVCVRVKAEATVLDGGKIKYVSVCTRVGSKKQAVQSSSAVTDGHQASADDEPGSHVLHGQHRQHQLQGHRAPFSKQAPQHAHPAAQGPGG